MQSSSFGYKIQFDSGTVETLFFPTQKTVGQRYLLGFGVMYTVLEQL